MRTLACTILFFIAVGLFGLLPSPAVSSVVSKPYNEYGAVETILAPAFVHSPKEKPYFYQNPNNCRWICSKHGYISPEHDEQAIVLETTFVAIDGIRYCSKCFYETINLLIGQHITGKRE